MPLLVNQGGTAQHLLRCVLEDVEEDFREFECAVSRFFAKFLHARRHWLVGFALGRLLQYGVLMYCLEPTQALLVIQIPICLPLIHCFILASRHWASFFSSFLGLRLLQMRRVNLLQVMLTWRFASCATAKQSETNQSRLLRQLRPEFINVIPTVVLNI